MPRTPRTQQIYTLYIFAWGSGVRMTRTPRERQPFPHEEAANLTMSGALQGDLQTTLPNRRLENSATDSNPGRSGESRVS
jgi:hypothetical protein